MNVHQSRKNPGNLCENEGQRIGKEFAAAPSFGFAPLRDCRRPITAARLTKKGRPLGGVTGSQALRIFLLGAVFVFSNPLSINQGGVHAREFDRTSASPTLGGSSPSSIRADRAEEIFDLASSFRVEKQFMSLPGAEAQPSESEHPAQESEQPAQPAAPDARPPNEIDQYLWSVYQRSGTKRDSTGDFTWKDEAAAARLGLLTKEYVIGGMDPDFRKLLYDLGHAMDGDGIHWTILSAFRDDYRQGLAAGFKAHRGYSFHGGSVATGGYGHGCAADLGGSDGSTDSNNMVWKWLDQHGEQFRIYRPMRQIDPAHIQPSGGWHERAAELRDKRVEIRRADLPAGTANTVVDGHVFPVVASHSGVSEAQFECVRSHRHSVEHVRTAGLLSHLKPRMARVLDRTHRHARWRMVADIRDLQKRPGAEALPNTDEIRRNAKLQTLADIRSPEKRPGAEALPNTDEIRRNAKLRTLADIRSPEKRPGAEALPNTDEIRRSAKLRTAADIRNPERRRGAEALPNTDEIRRSAKLRTVADIRSPEKHPAAEPLLNTDEAHRNTKLRTVADIRNPQKRPAAEPLLNADRTHRNARSRMLADIRSLQRRPPAEAVRRHARSKAHLHFVGPVFDAAGRRS